MKFIDKKDKKYFKIFGIVVVVIWNIIILAGFFLLSIKELMKVLKLQAK